MPFYVKLGPRGFFFRFGTLLIGFCGSYTYWKASRKRKRSITLIARSHLKAAPGHVAP